MSFSDVWNAAYEGLPSDNENINLGAGRIRDLKENVRERANIDHSWGDALDNGKHYQATLINIGGTPSTRSGTDGLLWASAVGNNTELFYQDSSGRTVQLTSDGVVSAPSPFASGTAMFFSQSSPPTGWTQVNISDHLIRVVNDGSGGGLGGSWTISGTSLSLNAGSLAANGSLSGSVSGTVAGHALSASEIPSHTHGTTVPVTGAANGGSATGGVNAVFGNTAYTSDGGSVGNGSHSHGWSGTVSGTVASSVSGSPAGTFSNDGTWRPAYINTLLATKN